MLHPRDLVHPSTSTSPAATAPFSIVDYLVGTCGLTAAQALKASKKLSHLSSASNPDAVLALLPALGLSRRDVAAVVAADPSLLCSRVANISRRLASLRDRVGLSDPQIARFLLAGGAVGLRSCDVAAKLDFWIPFLGGSFERLLQTVKRNSSLLTADLDKAIKPNVALLRDCGLSVCDIAKLTTHCSRLLSFSPERLKSFVLRVENLGVPRTCYLFKQALAVVCTTTEDKVAMRMEFLRTILGCSKDKITAAVCKTPCVLQLSEETLRRKIEFMITEIGLEPEYIVEWPMLLNYSLERRIAPRHCVVKILRTRGLMEKSVGFLKLITLGEKHFIARYIDCHKDTVPGLADAYAAAYAEEVPAKVL